MTKHTMTKQSYGARRAELLGHLAAATQEKDRVAMAVELGNATEADLKVARDSANELQDRLSGLDAAWRGVLADRQRSADAAEQAQRKADLATVEAALAARKTAAGRVAKLIEQLGAAFEEYRAPVSTLRDLGRRYLAQDALNGFRGTIEPIDQRDLYLVISMLARAGVSARGIEPNVFETWTLLDWTDRNGRDILNELSCLEAEEAEMAEAA